MKKIIIVIIVLLVVAVGIYFVISNNKPNTNQVNIPISQPVTEPTVDTTTVTSTTTTKTTTATVSEVTVSIKNISFNPQTLTIKAGTKVTWINNDPMDHTVASDSDNLLNSPALSPGQSFSFTFTNPGTTNYHCNIHKTMKGVVIVE